MLGGHRVPTMRFELIDQIIEVVPGKQLIAVKNLTLGEAYLADHFPSFPVMPGVLMLEALVQAGAWLIRFTEDFAHSVIVLREAKGVKYGTFVEPGHQMRVVVDWQAQDDREVTFKGKAEVNGNSTVSARLALARCNLGDRDPNLRETDAQLIAHYRMLSRSLLAPAIIQTAVAG